MVTLIALLLSAHNQARAQLGVPPLTWSTSLENIARNWAASLLANGKFEHSSHSRYGENLFEIRGASASPSEVVETLGQRIARLQFENKYVPSPSRMRSLYSGSSGATPAK